MGIKRDELVNGCFAKAADDEPLFVLRATDKVAPAVIHYWISCAQRAGTPDAKIAEAKKLLQQMVEYQERHGAKTPD